jgi:hypothetical protein
VMVYFLLLVFVLFKTQYARRSESHSMYYETVFSLIAVLLIYMIGTMHRMWIFSIFIIIGYLIARPLHGVKKMVMRQWGIWNKRKHDWTMNLLFILWIGMIGLFIYAQLENIGVYSGMNLWYKYQWGLLFSGTSFETLFLNMAIDYWSGWGLISAFIIIGAFVIFRKKNKNFASIFLISIIILTAPIATLGLYSKLILIIFATPLIAMGIIWFVSQKRLRRISVTMLFVILMISGGFNILMVEHWQNAEGGDYMKNSEYDQAMFVKYNMNQNDTYISNNQVFGNQVLSVADTQFMTEGFLYPLIYGWVTRADIENVLDWQEMIDEQSIEIKYPEEYALTLDHRQIHMNPVDNTMFLRSIYNVNYAVDSSVSTTNYWIEPSLYETRYMIFINQDGRIWYLG